MQISNSDVKYYFPNLLKEKFVSETNTWQCLFKRRVSCHIDSIN